MKFILVILSFLTLTNSFIPNLHTRSYVRSLRCESNDDDYFYFEKKISEENYEKIMNLGDKSIQPEEKLIRIYPEKNLFSHILGQIDEDNNGISGLEKTLDKELKRVEKPIELTIDNIFVFCFFYLVKTSSS